MLVHHLPASLFLFIMFLLVVFHGMMPLFGGRADCHMLLDILNLMDMDLGVDVYVYISMRV